jgi:4'-phosphopantetheinyl transferase
LDRTPAEMDELENYLAPDERGKRKGGLLTPRSKNRSIAARGLLRMLLSRHLGVPADQLVFEYSPSGKPFIRISKTGQRLFIDVSHSDNVALFAFSCDDELGIDVEVLNTQVDHLSLAKRTFSSEEFRTISALPVESRASLFCRLWTAKEAFVKALGRGMRSLKVIQLQVGERHFGALASELADPEITFHGEISIIRAEKFEMTG